MAVSYWVEQMARDVDNAMQDRKESLMRNELQKFMEHSVGAKPKATTWIPQF